MQLCVNVVMLLIKRTGRTEAVRPCCLPSVQSVCPVCTQLSTSLSWLKFQWQLCAVLRRIPFATAYVYASVWVPLCECFVWVWECLYVLTPWSHASFASLANSTRAQINFATSTSSHMHRLSALVQPYSLGSKCSKNNHATRCPKAIKANGSTAKITYLYPFPITNHSRTHTHKHIHEHRHILQVATKMRAATACFNKQWSWRWCHKYASAILNAALVTSRQLTGTSFTVPAKWWCRRHYSSFTTEHYAVSSAMLLMFI